MRFNIAWAAVAAQNVTLKVGVVAGDDIMTRLADFVARGIELKNMDTGAPRDESGSTGSVALRVNGGFRGC